MANNLYGADAPVINSTAVTVRTTAEDLETDIHELKRYVEDQVQRWLGPASKKYKSVMDDFEVRANQMIVALDSIGNTLQEAGATIDNVEMGNARTFKLDI